jgi:hypothetical protein
MCRTPGRGAAKGRDYSLKAAASLVGAAEGCDLLILIFPLNLKR